MVGTADGLTGDKDNSFTLIIIIILIILVIN